ncbi:hypothetical protein DID95_09925 [Vibrio fluvialis]|nr:hypothetical protein [Vibrio fluvialis]
MRNGIDLTVQFIQNTFVMQLANNPRFSMNKIPKLILSIKQFYSYVSFESLSCDVYICSISGKYDNIYELDGLKNIATIEYVANEFDLERRNSPILFMCDEHGDFFIKYISSEDGDDILAILSTELVYHLDGNKQEKFHFEGDEVEIFCPPGRSGSFFAETNFKTLEESLEDYKINSAKRTSCYILKDIWEDARRVVFKNKPESTMRNSLCQHISTTLRGVAEVRPEQNVDESHPVDIKVTFRQTNRVALIEIKWLGASRTESGGLTRYANSRAEEGAKQLNDYIEENNDFSPLDECFGYLVVFDGRRRKYDNEDISPDDLTYYKNKDLEFKLKYHEIRNDFAKPIRFFMEPKLIA